jgi:8-oxo-dGTP pyrophosphatase MutT (NUDIX family)
LRSPVPGWLRELADHAEDFPALLPQMGAPPEDGRRSAVLILFGPRTDRTDRADVDGAAAADDPATDVLLTERSHDMRSHAGQIAFPGGEVDPGDGGPVDAALREAWEETGLDVTGVEVLAVLPDIWMAPSGFVVTPVLAWWAVPSPVGAVDPREVARVARVAVDELLDPANRFQVRHPSGYTGPGFWADGMYVWGFTAGLLDRVLTEAGLGKPWDTTRFEPLPDHLNRPHGPSASSGRRS